MTQNEQEGTAERTAFLDAIEELLRPLMGLVLSYGVAYGEIQQVLKVLYIDTLSERLKAQGRHPTIPRLALMAGLNRSEVEVLLANRAQRRLLRTRDSKKLDQLSSLLAIWHDDQRFSTPYGAPLDLSLIPERGFRSFDDLLEAACPGIDRDLVIDELLAAGSIEVHAQKFVRCISRAFVPTGIDVSRISRLGRYVGALSSNFAHNLLRPPNEPAFFERVFVTEGAVNQACRDGTLEYLRTEGQTFLEKLDRWINSNEERFLDADGKRYGVGMFFFEDSGTARESDAPMDLGLSREAS